MIASVLTLTRQDWRALDIRDPYSVHKVVYSLFPLLNGRSRDFLYAEKNNEPHLRKILILSEREPTSPEYGVIESKQIPETFLSHTQYGFEIRLNPTRRDSSSGQTIAVLEHKALKEWFLTKSEKNGFHVDAEKLDIKETGVQTFEKGGKRVVHNIATFAGTLEVIDHTAFCRAFREGIGRAKAFGFGLLLIVPLNQ